MTEQKSNPTRGYIIPIGGGENKDKKPVVLKKFVELCGGENAHIAIIPTASRLSDTASQYQSLFHRLGAMRTDVLNIKRRSDCESPSHLKLLETVSGVFMTGGDQLRLAAALGGTKLAAKMRELNEKGLHIAGTSAGAAFISEHMIAGGKTGNTPRMDMVKLATGLGLSKELIIDQHFRQRHRIGRLVTAITFNPSAIGLGIDEDTAAFIKPDNTFEVVGSGWITIVDPTAMESSTIDSAKKLQRLSVADLKVHMLTSGDEYDIKTRTVKLC